MFPLWKNVMRTLRYRTCTLYTLPGIVLIFIHNLICGPVGIPVRKKAEISC